MQSRELARLPKWADTDRFSIEARASPAAGNPTKDQLRLMLQSLLVERFHLAAHLEARKVPVFELELAKPGRPGPKLRPHAEGPPCDKPGFPPDCHSLTAIGKPGTTLIEVGARDVPMEVLARAFSGTIPLGLGRPVIDRTGLTGTFDFTLEWAPAATSASTLPSAADEPAPVDALRTQLGLKLQPAKSSLPILVIDHVERPSEN